MADAPPTPDTVRAIVTEIVQRMTAETAETAEVPTPGRSPTRVAIGADHGGFRLKERLAADLRDRGLTVHDCGTRSADAVDYPDIAHAVAGQVASGASEVGILLDGAGIGSAIAANKVPGIRAATCWDVTSAINSREHNHANVLALGAGLLGENLVREIVNVWLSTAWGPDRHARRVDKITGLDHHYRTRST